MKTRILILLAVFGVMQTLLAQTQVKQPSHKSLAFSASGTNEFVFDTGVLRGKLRAEGESRGLSSVVHIPTGRILDSSMGLFGHYRVFSANKRYGTGAWHWPSEARLQPDGSVAVRWLSTEERPFELRALYRWAASSILDVETIVQAKTNLTRFESFLASYFAPGFTNSLAYVNELPAQSGVKGFMAAEQSAGVWLAFPREDSVASIIRDGRWTYPPSPVDWVMMPRLAKPLGIRRDPATGLTAVLMSRPDECFAVSTPHQTEQHYSMYLSLFGRDLKPGETARTRARLIIASNLADADILKAYEEYAARSL